MTDSDGNVIVLCVFARGRRHAAGTLDVAGSDEVQKATRDWFGSPPGGQTRSQSRYW
jgi:hypothetical protein